MNWYQQQIDYSVCRQLTHTAVLSWLTDLVFNCSDNVQIWQTWFHHQHVSSFSHITFLNKRNGRPLKQLSAKISPNVSSRMQSTHHSSNGKSSCSRRQLIAAPVPKCRFGLCSISVDEHSRWHSCGM